MTSKAQGDGSFVCSMRVYYEDTDAAGIVYYANYLKFAERARTEMLRSIGLENSRIQAEHDVVFAVKRCNVEYIQPARLDDLIDVTLTTTKVGGASIEGIQEVSRDGVLLARLELRLACIDGAGRPARMPPHVRTKMTQLMNKTK